MQTPIPLNQIEHVNANRRGQITAAQRKAAGVLGTAIVFVILLGMAGFMGGAYALMGLSLLAEGEWAGLALGGLALVIAGPLAAYAVFRLVGVLRLQQDLNEGRLEQTEGEVRWTGRRYAAEWAGRPRWASNTATGLSPGAYRFFYLPRSGHLLSAAALPGLTLGAEHGLEAVLRRVHRFDEADVDLNRHGRLSPRQRQRLVASAAGFGLFGALIAGACAFGAWGVTIDGEDDAWVAVALLVFMAVIFALLMANLGVQLLRDAAVGSVKQVTGPVRRSFRSSGKSTSFYYHVKNEQFTVSATAYNALAPDQEYRVYYTPRSRRIVALELLPGNPSSRGTL